MDAELRFDCVRPCHDFLGLADRVYVCFLTERRLADGGR